MAVVNPYQQYMRNRVFSAPPEELVLMLYDGSIKFMKQAEKAINEKNIEQANNYIIKAQNIFTELKTNLNREIEISDNLYSLYDYMYRRLVDANMKKDVTVLHEVQDLVQELRESWAEAIKIARKEA